jgi:hypothetical protein
MNKYIGHQTKPTRKVSMIRGRFSPGAKWLLTQKIGLPPIPMKEFPGMISGDIRFR